jgi:hypothetical protein
MSSGQTGTARTLAEREPGLRTRSSVPAPLVLDRYRLHKRLGAGAFGTVWMARDERLERDVAVKILPRERVMSGRFEREARAAARLGPPGIVTLYEAAVDDEGAYLVSELVLGATLDDLLNEGRLSDRDIVAVGVAVCDALQYAHAQGVVHRDVKPSNILIPSQPASPSQLAKLTDFGVARVVGGDSLTRTGDVVGTLAYMAPEQAEGLEVNAAADVYSLALVLYEALTGVNPVSTGTAAQRARRLGAYLPPLRRQRRDLPRELGVGVDLALRPRPRERGTIPELRRALAAAHEIVADDPGVVGDPWTRQDTRQGETGEGQVQPPAAEPRAAWRARLGRWIHGAAEAEDDPTAQAVDVDQAWVARGLAAATAALTAAWLTRVPLAPAPLAAPLAAFLAAAITLLLPRVGWLALTTGAAGAALTQEQPGIAVLLLIAMLLPVALTFRRPTDWPLAAIAPVLGLVSLAGAWPALAGRAVTVWRRAVLGFTGWIWLLIAAPLADRVLYLPRVPGTPPLDHWAGSANDTIHHVLKPILTSGALAPALVWAAAAAVLPWLVLRRSLALDLVRVVIWAAVLVSATGVAITAVHGENGLRASPSATLGAVAAAAVAIAPSVLSAWRDRAQSGGGSQVGFP